MIINKRQSESDIIVMEDYHSFINESTVKVISSNNKFYINHSDINYLSETYDIELDEAYQMILESNRISNEFEVIPVLNEEDIIINPEIVSLYETFVIKPISLKNDPLYEQLTDIIEESLEIMDYYKLDLFLEGFEGKMKPEDYDDGGITIDSSTGNVTKNKDKKKPEEKVVTIDASDYKEKENVKPGQPKVVPTTKARLKFGYQDNKGKIFATAAVAGGAFLARKQIAKRIGMLSRKLEELQYKRRTDPKRMGFINRMIEKIKRSILILRRKLNLAK